MVRKGRLRGAGLALVAVLSIATVASTAVAPTAVALINEDGRGVNPEVADSFIGVKSAHNGREMGTFVVGGTRVICIDTGSDYPSTLTTASTRSDNPLVAFMMAKYGSTTDDLTAAALWYIVNIDGGLSSNPSWVTSGWEGSTHYAELQARRTAMLAAYDEATVGDYELIPRITLDSNKQGGTASYTIDPAASSAVTLTLSGPAAFTSNGSTSITLAAGTTSARFESTGTGEISLRAVAEDVYNGTYRVFPAPSAGVQRTVASGALTPLEGQDPTRYAVIDMYTPSVTTRTSAQLVSGETVLTDTVMVSGGEPGAGFSGTTSLYGPFASDPSKGAELTADLLVGVAQFSGTYGSDGKATVTSGSVMIPAAEPGQPVFYVWSEQLDGTGTSEPTDPAPPRPAETTVSVNPTIATQINDQTAIPGQRISDDVQLEGLVDQVGDSPIVWTVEGSITAAPMVNDECAWDQGTVVHTIDPFTVDAGDTLLEGIGEYLIPADAQANTCYTYSETLTGQARRRGTEDLDPRARQGGADHGGIGAGDLDGHRGGEVRGRAWRGNR